MKITLAKIKKHNPCRDGWEQILEAQGPDLDREWELVEAFQSNVLGDIRWALRCLPEHNDLWRKYAVWCVMQVDHLLPDQRSKDALEVAWRHSDGQATNAELAAARAKAKDAASDAKAAAKAAAKATSDAAWAAVWASASDAAVAAAEAATYAAWASACLARDAAWAAAGSAASDVRAAARAAWVSENEGAKAAQKERLIQILSAGEWVEETENENNTR